MPDDVPAEPSLDKYRDAIASVHLDGTHVGYLATKVERVRVGLLLRREERVWLLLTLLDGRREPVQEDYAPWTHITELEENRITWAASDADAHYQVRWLGGDERRDAWSRYGIVQDVGAYMGATGSSPVGSHDAHDAG